MFHEVSLPNILLRGHDPICPPHPRPPSPPGAAGPRNRGLPRLPCAAVCCLGSRSPRPGRRQNPKERRGEKLWRKFGHLKSQSVGKCGHSKILPELQERCGFEDVLMTSSWLKRACEPRWQSKCFAETLKNVPSLRKQICGYACHWDKTEFEISPLR